MADRSRSDTSKPNKNPLLSGAGNGFPFENFSGTTLLMPVSQSSSSIFSEVSDVGDVDSFLGQDTSNDHSSPFRTGVTRPLGLEPQRPPSSGPSRPQSTGPPRLLSSGPDVSSFQPVPLIPTSSSPRPSYDQVYSPYDNNQRSSYSPFTAEPLNQTFYNPLASAQPAPSFPNFPPQPAPALFFTPGSAAHDKGPTPPLFAAAPSAVAPPQYGHMPSPPVASCAPYSIQQINPPVATVAPLTGTTNTYRLGNQRKPIYAPLPGLSVSAPVVASVTPLLTATPITSFNTPFVPALAATPIDTFDTPTPAQPNLSATPVSTFNTPAYFTTDTLPYASSPILTPYTPNNPSLATMTPTHLPSTGPAVYQSQGSVADLDQSETVLPPSFRNLTQSVMYRPVYHHWFFKNERDAKFTWEPFSMVDSMALERAFVSTDISADTRVPTDGGRYDVHVLRRRRHAVYWTENPSEVRRCSWFYKGATESRYVPYEENFCARLEEEYKIAMTSNEWHRKVEFPSGESIVMHGPNVMVHFLHSQSPDTWGNTPVTPTRPRVVKRGVDEFAIDDGEPEGVDHVLFLVHGIGSVCDLKFRTVEEVVNEFRRLSLQLVQSHFRTASELGAVSRVEVLPVSWHGALHGEDTGIDRKLKSITLHSIPKLRDFTNDTLLDILFYTSPVYCQTIMKTVGNEMNRLYGLFLERNPHFTGNVSLSGHSLGSLILFDLLQHQKPVQPSPLPSPQQPEVHSEGQEVQLDESSSRESSEEPEQKNVSDQVTQMSGSLKLPKPPLKRRLSQRVNYVMGHAGTGQPFIKYPQLNFQPRAFFALGSPIGMFVTVRGIEILGEEFHLPTCPGFFNIFHPFDPVAYRIETLINPDLASHRPVLIPHHKGRKRMHLELKETMARVGADLKQRLVESVRSTWNTVYQYAMFHRSNDQEIEQEVDKVLEEQMAHQEADGSVSDGEGELDIPIGRLNNGRRIDFVLQEAPLESFNEYLSALHGHLCYWESEDTMLMILKELYGGMGITADSQTLQHQIPLEPTQPSSSRMNLDAPYLDVASCDQASSDDRRVPLPAASIKTVPLLPPVLAQPGQHGPLGMDPTAPREENRNIGPPPMGGFVRK